MSEFENPRPSLRVDEVLSFLSRNYGITGSCSSLDSERDQNFLLSSEKGSFVVKISNVSEEASLLELQTAVLQHISKTDPGIGIPVLIPALNGSFLLTIDSSQGCHYFRVLEYLEGRQYYVARQDDPSASLGLLMGRISKALLGFGHAAAFRPEFRWNLDNFSSLADWVQFIQSPDRREVVQRVFERYSQRVAPVLHRLRAGVVHNDANDHNVIVNEGGSAWALIDFGDLCFGRVINELAVTLAYALLDVPDIFATARSVIENYCSVFPLQELEAEVLFDLVAARLATSVCISSRRNAGAIADPYFLVSQEPAFRLLELLDQTNPDLLRAISRKLCGFAAVGSAPEVAKWLSSGECRPAEVFGFSLNRSPRILLQMKEGAPGAEYAESADDYWNWLKAEFEKRGARFGIGLYGEVRTVYKQPQFDTPGSLERRSQHLGIDIFVEAGTPIYAPLEGRVFALCDNEGRGDYGPTVVLQHRCGERGPVFWTLYGHLSRKTLEHLKPGVPVKAGELLAWIGDKEVNGGWAPHLHFQLITDMLGETGNYVGAGQPSLWPVWSELTLDPNLVLRLAPESFVEDPRSPETLLPKRRESLLPSLSISYRNKLKIVRGRGAYLFDHTGRAYVDAVNNICHVGHSHPVVTAALSKQADILNTNTRYLHNHLIDYAEKLSSYFAPALSVLTMVCSGSEANELAIRMARTVTGRKGMVTLDWAYHGNTNAAIDVSPYKFNRKGGKGKPDHVAVAELPDPYRGRFKGYGAASGAAYAESLDRCIAEVEAATGAPPAAFIVEAISGCGGQVFFPEGYLKAAAEKIRRVGGLLIVDEVQTGFGRVGSSFWAYELQGVTPDIVTMGKPIGNGHPMAGVVTTAELAGAFANGMEFFSSFGGNPVSAAVGLAVLEVMEGEGLQENARLTGNYLKEGLRSIVHPLIGDVRGEGLFLGIELVEDREALTPATDKAGAIINLMKEDGVLASTDGPFDNVIKIKPPIVFGRLESDLLVAAFEKALKLV